MRSVPASHSSSSTTRCARPKESAMLLELKPGVAPAYVDAVNATVLALFEAIAADTAADPAELIEAAWPSKGGSPPKRELRAVLELPAEERAELLRGVRDDLRFVEGL